MSADLGEITLAYSPRPNKHVFEHLCQALLKAQTSRGPQSPVGVFSRVSGKPLPPQAHSCTYTPYSAYNLKGVTAPGSPAKDHGLNIPSLAAARAIQRVLGRRTSPRQT